MGRRLEFKTKKKKKMKLEDLSKEKKEKEKRNELNLFCRDIESLTRAGYEVQEAYRIIKKRYKEKNDN